MIAFNFRTSMSAANINKNITWMSEISVNLQGSKKISRLRKQLHIKLCDNDFAFSCPQGFGVRSEPRQ